MNLNSTESNNFKKLNYRDLLIFLVPILIFGLYLFVYKPGILTAASYSQLHQIATGHFTNAYPMLHTLIEILCLRIRGSPSTIGILQILVFGAMWMIICKYHRDDDASSSDAFVFQFIVTLIICLIPINAVYSITLSSNILFSYALMFLAFLIKVLIDRDGQINERRALLIALTLAAISGLNTFGVYIALISLVLIVGYLFKKGNDQTSLIKFSVIAVAFILLFSSLGLMYNTGQDNGSFPMNDAFDEGVNLKDARSQFFLSISEKPVKGYENVVSTNLGNGKYGLIDSFANLFRDNFMLGGLFDNPILYLILSIIVLGFIYITTQKNEMLLIGAPIIINTIIVFATGISNLYSNLLVFYLIVIIFISIYFNLDLTPKDITNATMPTGQKVESTPKPEAYQEYVEPQQEFYEEDYSYIEEELEELTIDDFHEIAQDIQIEETPEPKPDDSQENDALIDQILKEIELEKK